MIRIGPDQQECYANLAVVKRGRVSPKIASGVLRRILTRKTKDARGATRVILGKIRLVCQSRRRAPKVATSVRADS